MDHQALRRPLGQNVINCFLQQRGSTASSFSAEPPISYQRYYGLAFLAEARFYQPARPHLNSTIKSHLCLRPSKEAPPYHDDNNSWLAHCAVHSAPHATQVLEDLVFKREGE